MSKDNLRCNNCMTLFIEDSENPIYTCEVCDSDEFLMDLL